MSNMKLLIKEKEYNYTLNRKNVKRVNISVKSNSEIVVSSSPEVPRDYIENLLIKRSSWIDNKVDFFNKNINMSKPKKYVSGEDFLYLGKHYRLKLILGEKDVYILNDELVLSVKTKNDYKIKSDSIDNWYKEQSKKELTKHFEKTCKKYVKYDLLIPELIIRKMNSRWGTYNTQKNRMTLNMELVKAPRECIEYVIVHELIHQKHKKHNKDFYNMLSMMIPDWEKNKILLDEEIQRYLYNDLNKE